MKKIDVASLAAWLASNDERAFFDVREAGEINEGHIPGSTALPRRMIELQIEELVPRRSTPVLLCDEGGIRAALAAATLNALGYTDVAVLAGGVKEWARVHGALEQGKNVPSKMYAEHLFEQGGVPQVTADTLKQWIDSGKPHTVLDVRAFEEHAIGHIPGAHNVPGVEVVRIADDLIRAQQPVVVHCAGRTRSILGCQTLKDLGVEQAYALKDGTMGWTLAGYSLDKNISSEDAKASAQSIAMGEPKARELALGNGVEYIEATKLNQRLQARAQSRLNCYLIDVRQPHEYAEGHIKGAKSAAGGQAILFADEHAAVRNAEIIFVDDGEGQAAMTAYWFKRLGYPNVKVVEGGMPAVARAGCELERGKTRARPVGLDEKRERSRQLDVAATQALIDATPALHIVDVGTSKSYAHGHLPRAVWLPRGWLEPNVADLIDDLRAPVLVVCQTGLQSTYAAATLSDLGYSNVSVLAGGIDQWKKAGNALEQGKPTSAFAGDVVTNPYERSKDDMKKYLAWEQRLGAGANK